MEEEKFYIEKNEIGVEIDEPPNGHSIVYGNWFSGMVASIAKVFCNVRLGDIPCTNSRNHRKPSGLLCY